MRNKGKKKLAFVLSFFGVLFISMTFNNFQIIREQGINEEIIGIPDKLDLISPKISSYWTLDFIHVDGNWTATADNDWCNGNGSWSNPYMIENVIIDAISSPTGIGIFINNSKNEYFIIRNCTVYNAGTGSFDAGIRLENTDNGTLMNNTCSNNGMHGIILYDSCQNNTISGNTANNNDYCGIYLERECDENTISGNTANNNDYCTILLYDGCNENIISGNTASGNWYHGIYLINHCDENIISENTVNDNRIYGILLLDHCRKNTISGNTASGNGNHGIYLHDECGENTISRNLIYLNRNGIYLDTCQNNLIFSNYCFNNSDNNAIDDNGANDWDNGVIGNAWGDYNGEDANNDGIGDTPYDIPGSSGSKDHKPLIIYNQFFPNPPDDLTYEIGTEGHYIRWIIINVAQSILPYYIFREGTPIKTGTIFPKTLIEIIINVDHLEVGTYGFRIEVNDGYGGRFTDGVWVTVVNTAPVFTLQPSDLSYETGETGNYLSWIFSDASTHNPTYTITRNGVPIIVGEPCISGEVICISVDGLEVGVHGFVIEINDGHGGTILGDVWVRVYPATNPIPTSNGIDVLTPALIVVGSIAAVSTTGLVISMSKKRRLRLKRDIK